VPNRRNYNQNCPIARGLDILGERWTLLIVRELVGGPRRYSDLKAELPGIATNLLAERLKEMQDAGLVQRTDLPAPIGRTVYSLTDMSWQRVLPVVQSVAWFGLDRLDPFEGGPTTPLNGFLAGILLGFNSPAAAGLDATYRAEIDDRRFDFAIRDGRLAPAHGEPLVTVTGGAADLVTTRLGADETERKAAMRRVKVDGEQRDADALRAACSLR
jgi:DNA-binding HxlR family transcriptional regulator